MRLAYKILAVLNVFVTAWRCLHTWSSWGRPAAREPDAPSYSYRGYDYPFELPFGASDVPVALTLHETVHLPFNMSDDVAQMEWDNLVTAPKEAGRARLGPDHRVFTLTFWHHLHCLWSIQRALVEPKDTYAAYGHLQHCFNYLRQTLLCQAADGLELGDFMETDFENDRVGDTMVCRDWEAVYDGLEENYRNWTEWARAWN